MWRPALRPNKPDVQRVPRASFEGSNRPGLEAGRSLPFIAEVTKKCNYLSIPPSILIVL